MGDNKELAQLEARVSSLENDVRYMYDRISQKMDLIDIKFSLFSEVSAVLKVVRTLLIDIEGAFHGKEEKG